MPLSVDLLDTLFIFFIVIHCLLAIVIFLSDGLIFFLPEQAVNFRRPESQFLLPRAFRYHLSFDHAKLRYFHCGSKNLSDDSMLKYANG